MADKLWFEGQTTYTIIFTEEDLRKVLADLTDETIRTRILFQMRHGGKNVR